MNKENCALKLVDEIILSQVTLHTMAQQELRIFLTVPNNCRSEGGVRRWLCVTSFADCSISAYPWCRLKKICPTSFRKTCQCLKFPLNGLRSQSRVSPVTGFLPLASASACLGMAFHPHLDRLQNKYTNYKGIKNNTNSGQITGVQEKLDTTCK